MITINIKLIVALTAVIALLIAVAALSMEKQAVTRVGGAQQSVSLTRASFFQRLSRPVATLRPASGSPVIADISDRLFEYPMLLVPGVDANSVLCVYNFDVGYRVLAFDLQSPPRPLSDELQLFVPRTTIGVRFADRAEVQHAIATINAMDATAYRAASLPTLNLGVVSIYAKKSEVIARLSESPLPDIQC